MQEQLINAEPFFRKLQCLSDRRNGDAMFGSKRPEYVRLHEIPERQRDGPSLGRFDERREGADPRLRGIVAPDDPRAQSPGRKTEVVSRFSERLRSLRSDVLVAEDPSSRAIRGSILAHRAGLRAAGHQVPWSTLRTSGGRRT